MSDIAIRVENLSKRYRIGQRAPYQTLRDVLANAMTAPFRRLGSALKCSNVGRFEGATKHIWALRDVSFEVRRGEVVGIIGRNGAGKTTLLKILSRVTEPTKGYAEIHGRVGSLLEIGTGFHPELSGRENIYLNGAILGMKSTEIARKFDEIVSFAEVEEFLETPVKRYSSGMYVRLAFAVAAHLEPEILLVDEVLAVGDAAFQSKCLGKMGDIAKQGRTVLFVSHNMSAVERLCKRVALLEEGKIEREGAPRDVIQHYLQTARREGITGFWAAESHPCDSLPVALVTAFVATESEEPKSLVKYDDSFVLVATYRVRQRIRTWSLVFRVVDSSGNVVFASSDTDGQFHPDKWQEPDSYRAVCMVPSHLLKPGVYAVTVITHIPRVRVLESHEHLFSFQVSDSGYSLSTERVGIIAPVLQWRTDTV